MKETKAQPPRATPNIDLKRLPLRPEEAFVFSRVDGRAWPKDIALMTGMSLEQVERALARLDELGALEEGRTVPSNSSHRLNATSSEDMARGGAEMTDLALPHAEDDLAAGDRKLVGLETTGDEFDGFVPAEDLDIPVSEQRRVWQVCKRLETCNHYEALGLARSATKEQVKAAYFERVATFHPDKHFGKRLGSYKERFELVFQRLTAAHDTLSRSQRRREYDAGLPPLAAGETSSEDALRGVGPSSARAQPSVPRESASASAVTAGVRSTTTDIEGGSMAPRSSPRSESSRSRGPAPAESQRSLPPVSIDERRQMAAKALHRGLRSMPSGERPAPAPARRPPSAPPPSSRSAGLERARSLESRGDWETAAAIYEKFGAAHKDAHLFAKAALCLERAAPEALEPSAVWKRAAESARHAVQLSPNNGALRLQLSRMYAHAGLRASALREAERAQELSPSEKSVQSWLERVRRGDV